MLKTKFLTLILAVGSYSSVTYAAVIRDSYDIIPDQSYTVTCDSIGLNSVTTWRPDYNSPVYCGGKPGIMWKSKTKSLCAVMSGTLPDNLRRDIGDVQCHTDTGSFSYAHGAAYDFGWTVENDAPHTITGSFYTVSNNHYASWNNLSLDSKSATPYDPSSGVGLGAYISDVDHNIWTADLIYNGKKYLASGICDIGRGDLDSSVPVHVLVQGNENWLVDLLIGTYSSWCPVINFIQTF